MLFDLFESVEESLAVLLGPHIESHEENESPDRLGEDASLLLLGGDLGLGSECLAGEATLPPAHEADANGEKVDGVKLIEKIGRAHV